jgi:hypothetical protein
MRKTANHMIILLSPYIEQINKLISLHFCGDLGTFTPAPHSFSGADSAGFLILLVRGEII